MKKMLICITSFICLSQAIAQNNVGINTTNPQANLDVRGSQRIGGNSSFMRYDSATGRMHIVSGGLAGGLPHGGSQLAVESNNHTYMNLLSPNGNETGLLFGKASDASSGSIIYNNSFNVNGLQFRTNGNSTRMVINDEGRIGIGTAVPATNLHIYANPSFGVHYSGAQLTIENSNHTYLNFLSQNHNETGVLFGKASDALSGSVIYNSSATLNGLQFRTNGNQTRMVIDDVGRVGIGTTTPNAPLTFPPALGKKITFYPGATGDVGLAVQGNLLQIYSDNPNADIAFGYDQAGNVTERMRIKGNGNVGIGTNNPQFKLDVNGDMKLSGQLNINGNEGSTGQVLQSNGPGAAPAWSTGTNFLYNNSFSIANSISRVISAADGSVQLPGMSQEVIVSGHAKAMISYTIAFETMSCGGCAESNVFVDLIVDGFVNNRNLTQISNSFSSSISLNKMLTLSPGSHTISLAGRVTGPDVRFTPCCEFESILNIQVVQQ